MKLHSFLLILTFISLSTFTIQAQDLEALMDQTEKKQINYTTAAFKTTRVINLHSIENTHKGVLDFRISHRFGQLNSGWRDLWGLDNAMIRFNFEYGISDDLMIGLSRSTYQKTYEGYFKYKLLKQSTGAIEIPFTLSLYSNVGVNTVEAPAERQPGFENRLSFTNSIIIGRKFNDKLSLQLNPIHVHKNMVTKANESNDVLAIGTGGRYKVSNRVALTAEYIYLVPDETLPQINGVDPVNSFSVGVDIETGGHVFQLHLTNSVAMVDKAFVSETTSKWGDGGIYFGFNIMRAFQIN
ncbi:DUF5777 family beta-barrel protein [Limibacter armeniacum]|uniref:DUF5777 family beta-barrel protein n=1 Tax=Limibacter armeniacum TaxID=466084 RepID=UPI002FE6942D